MQTIELKSYNIWGQLLQSGSVQIDETNKTITTPSGKKFNVIPDYEFTYKINKRDKIIKASGGLDGLSKFLTKINDSGSPFNPCVTSLFIEL